MLNTQADAFRKPCHALAVDDNTLILLDIEYLLSTVGVSRVSPITDVADALKTVMEDRPDFALIEYFIGQQTTVQLAIALQKLSVPFAFVTAIAEPLDLPPILRGSRVLSKPYSYDEFNSVVRDLVRLAADQI
jgi:CheY-like chemotaxis protein